MNHGIKLALSGKSVRNMPIQDAALDTDYGTLNMLANDIDPNLGVINVTFANPGNVAGTNVLLFRKVLDPTYPQVFLFGFNQTKSANALGAQYGVEFDLDVFADRQFKVTKVANIVEFRYLVSSSYTPSAGDDLTAAYYQFQFAFYMNQGV